MHDGKKEWERSPAILDNANPFPGILASRRRLTATPQRTGIGGTGYEEFVSDLPAVCMLIARFEKNALRFFPRS